MLPLWAQNNELWRGDNTSYKVLHHMSHRELPTYYLLGLWSCHMLCSSLLHSRAWDHIALLSHWSIWGKQAKSNVCFTSLTIRFSVEDWHMTTLHNRVYFITVTRLYPASLKSWYQPYHWMDSLSDALWAIQRPILSWKKSCGIQSVTVSNQRNRLKSHPPSHSADCSCFGKQDLKDTSSLLIPCLM